MSNETKSRALGMNFGTAGNRLRKLILFDLLQQFDLDQCFQCGQQIEDVDDLSIEHREPWQSAPDPKASFFDLENIAFSHLGCNSAEGNRNRVPRETCYRGHLLTGQNRLVRKDGRVQCRICRRASQNTEAERRRKREYYKEQYHIDVVFREHEKKRSRGYYRRIAGAD